MTRMAEFVVAGALHVATLGAGPTSHHGSDGPNPMSIGSQQCADDQNRFARGRRMGPRVTMNCSASRCSSLMANFGRAAAPADLVAAATAAAELAEALAELRSALSYGAGPPTPWSHSPNGSTTGPAR